MTSRRAIIEIMQLCASLISVERKRESELLITLAASSAMWTTKLEPVDFHVGVDRLELVRGRPTCVIKWSC